ncbi:MAG TPA: SDR family oxidoreductase [Actinomycetota bacterium]|nr:SDR family oxidoreductase [Actinomycetota bacterium]
MDLGLEGRTALVTASSKGLGRGSALALAAEGANLVLAARGKEALDATAREVEAAGVEVLAIPCDVTDPDTPRRLVDAAVDRFGRVDVLVGNSGGPPPARALDVDDESLNKALNANLLTHIRLVKAVVPHMRTEGWGRICLITSSFIKQPNPALALSNTARTGLWAWAKTAAQDLFDDGITLNLACPGLHATDRMKELGTGSGGEPMGDPEDFGKVVAFLCSEAANFVSGAALQVDGARTAALL